MRRMINYAPPDIVVSGIESVTDIGGGLVRICYYVNRIDGAGAIERCPLDHAHVMPVSAVSDAIAKGLFAMARKVIARPDGSLTVAH